jgi:hypothetical protein
MLIGTVGDIDSAATLTSVDSGGTKNVGIASAGVSGNVAVSGTVNDEPLIAGSAYCVV